MTERFRAGKTLASFVGAVATATMMSEMTQDVMGREREYFPNFPKYLKPFVVLTLFALHVAEVEKIIRGIDQYYVDTEIRKQIL